MNLVEAIAELEEHGYIVEGKIGRALAAGALALGLATGNSHALSQEQVDAFEKQTEEVQSTEDEAIFTSSKPFQYNRTKVHSYIKDGNYYFKITVLEGSNYLKSSLLCLYDNGTFKLRNNYEYGYSISNGTYSNHGEHSLDEIVGNLNLLKYNNDFEFNTYNEIYLKNNQTLRFSVEKSIQYDLDKTKKEERILYKNHDSKLTTYFPNGEVKSVTIEKDGITKTLCSDGSIVHGAKLDPCHDRFK